MSKPIAIALLLSAAAVPAMSGAQARDAAVVSAGSEQAVRIGKTVVSRPFGAQLVDRIAIIGTYSADGNRFYLVRGDGGRDCPARYVVIAARGEGGPHATEPFGTCAANARARIVRGRVEVTMTATAAGGPPVRFGYMDGAMRLLDAKPASRIATADGSQIGFAPASASSCRSSAGVGADEQAATIADFERSYPDQYRKISSLKKADIAPDELRSLVVGLACLSTWPGAQEVVPAMATPLFASKRYGAPALDALETVSRDGLSDVNMRAATRVFGAEMNYRVARRGPL